MMKQVQCTVCASTEAKVFIEVPRVPVICNVLWPTHERATSAPRVDINLAFCPHCGHIFNPDFDPAIMQYTEAYENSLHFSPRFQRYADQLAQDLVERYQLQEKSIIDIGGGKGDFLKLLCALGNNRGISIDPSFAAEAETTTANQQITYIQDYYSEKYAHLQADFTYSRHTLEHIQHPAEFMGTVSRTVGARPGSYVFFEVPNALFTLHDLAIWDIIYEHCSYFTSHSLAYLFSAAGLQVTDVRPTFEGQFLCIEAMATTEPLTPIREPEKLAAIAQDVATFADNYRQKIAQEKASLSGLASAGQKAVIWGAGSKGITFLNTLQLQDVVEYAVDINPRKHGMYITGTGQQIVPPEFLRQYRPDAVIVMNAVYVDEIRQIMDGLGLQPELLTA